MAGFTRDPDDLSVPFSHQRKYLLDVIEEGLKAMGDTEATARVQLDLYSLEVWNDSRAYPDEPNPYMLGKPGEGDV
jgi:hypothetical protein